MNTKFTVYVLFSLKINKRYIGYTKNLESRIAQHNKGESTFTKRGIPWKLVYSESFSNKSDALKREKFLKTGQGRKYLDTILNNRRGAGVVERDGLENR